MWMLLLFLLNPTDTSADQFEGITLREVSIDYRSYFPGGTDAILKTTNIPNQQLDKKLDLHVNMDVLEYLYWDNMISSTTDKYPNGGGQFRVVGWNFRFGIRITNNIQLGYFHYSQHLLDVLGTQHFPVEDAIQFKITIYRRESNQGLFSL